MEIKDIQGNILIDALVTEQAVKVDELMKQHSITLSWVSVTDEQLPLGAYIEHEGVRYLLLAPYDPEQSDEATYTYKPVFEHPIMRWQHIPFFFYTYSEGKVISKELDWSLTDNPANFMKAVCDAILNETGEDWSYEISADLPASASQSFSNTDIFSALNAIAGAFETEWWFDYANKIVYLSKAAYGDAVTLEVGQNIGIPSKNQSKEGYYTRFYAFGSTRNIDQSYAGSNVNSIVNRRLTLDPAKYPNGYIDIREGLTQEEVLPVSLVFDDIYPRSSLTISDVKVRLMWRLDGNSEKVQIGTDSEGNPVYDQYAIWYFKIPELSFSKDILIESKALSVHFNSGALNGREFKLTYHDTAKEVTTSDGTSIQVEVGDYEINFIEEGTYIIPAITGLVPMEGDAVTLFNIVMPEEYKASAYEELEQEVRKEIAKQGEDRNNYTFDSNKVAFFESNPNLAVGRNVLYKNGSTTLATRVIRLETQLDYAFEQKITIGNEQIKGTTQTLKEEVVNANQSIDLLAAINENTEAFQQSLQRTQKAVLDSLAKWGDMWVLDPANGAVRTRYNVVSEKEVIAQRKASGVIPDAGQGVGYGRLDNWADWDAETMLTYVLSAKLGVSLNERLKNIEQNGSGLNEDDLKKYLDNNNYLQEKDIADLRTTVNGLDDILNGGTKEVIDTWNEVVDFLDGYKDSEDLATILSGMNTDIANRVLIGDFEKLEEAVNPLFGYFDANGSANNALKLGGHSADYYATADALAGVANTISAVEKRVTTLEDLGLVRVKEGDSYYIKSIYSIVSEGEMMALRRASGSGSGGGGTTQITAQMITDALGYVPYSSLNPAGYITSAAIPTALKNPYSITINGTPYDGSEPVNITISGGGGVADSVDWANVENKPTTLGGYGITDALSVNGGTILGDITTNSIRTGTDSIGVYIEGKSNLGLRMQYQREDGGYDQIIITNQHMIFNNNEVIHSGNYSNYALPLSGGTFNFSYRKPDATTNPRVGQFDRDAGSLVFQVGTSDIFDIVDSGWKNVMLRVAPNEFSYYGNSIIHFGNIGSQSVASADIISNGTYHYPDAILTNDITADVLFGEAAHENKVFPAFFSKHPLFGGQWADVLHYTGYCKWGATQIASEYNAINPRVAIRKYNQTRNDWGDWTEFITTANIGSQSVNYANYAGLADYSVYTRGFDYTQTQLDLNNLSRPMWWWYGQGNSGLANTPYAYGYGGGITFKQADQSSLNGQFAWDTIHNVSNATNSLWFRTNNNLGWGSWKQVAFTDSNVASASKLQTGRYFWGNYFNGESDVNGQPLFRVSSANTSINVDMASIIVGPVTSSRQGYSSGVGFNGLLGYGGYDNHLHGWIGLNGYYSGVGAEIYALVFAVNDNTNYGSAPTERMRITPNGNVLIGTTTDAGSKLQVYGSAILNNSYFGSDGVWRPSLGAMRDGTIGLAIYESMYGLWAWTNATSGDSYLQVARNDNLTNVYNLLLQPYGGNILIGTESDNGNKLQVNGSITATEWLYGGENCGMYITNTGVYYSNIYGYANIESAGNEICIGGNTGGTIYVNYRVPRHYNRAPTSWVWCAGSSYSRADHYIGNLVATGEVISLRRASSSDARLKDNINRLIAEDCLAIVRNLQPSSWQWKEDGKFSLGFIAQDIEPMMPYAVTRIKDEVLGQRLNLQYDQFFAPVVGAIQCLDVKVENHETRLKRLETENAELKKRLSKYETVWL